MGNFLCDRKILHAAIASIEARAVWTRAHVRTHWHTYKSVPFMLQIEACLQNNNVYKRFSLHIHFAAEPSAIKMCEMNGSMAKLIGSNVMICHACGAVPGLTQPSQALSLSNVCSPPSPPHPKHQYLDICTNVIHKPIHKRQMVALIHTYSIHRHRV